MTLTAERNTISRANITHNYPLAASTKLYKGQFVVLNAAGNLEAATLATGKIAAGIMTETVDNSAGIAGALSGPVQAGCFKFGQSGTTIDKTIIGDVVYIYDDYRVQISATGSSAAGQLTDLEADGSCWVNVYVPPLVTTGLLAANNLSDVGTNLTALNNLLGGTANLVAAANSIDRVDAGAIAIGKTNATLINIGATATPVVVGAAGTIAAPSTISAAGALTASNLLQTKTATYTVQTPAIDGESTIQDLTDNAVITLPATSAANKGMKVTLQNTAANGAALVQFTANASDGIYGTVAAVTLAKAAGSATALNTKATAKKGDYLTLQSDGAGNWWVVGGVGVWA